MNSYYKHCMVPQCKNTTIKTPDKLFIYVPSNQTKREKWLTLANRSDAHSLSIATNRSMYFCEDHFDLPNDMENYMEYHVMGSVSQVRMKPGCVPTKFACQPDRKSRTSNTTERPYVAKRRRKMIVEECEKELEEKTIVKELSSKEIPSNSSVADPLCDTTAVTIKTEPELDDVSSMTEQSNHSEDYTNDLQDELDIKDQVESMDDDECMSPDLDAVKLEVEEHSVPYELNAIECPVFEPCTRQMLPRIDMFAIIQFFVQNSVAYEQLDYNKLRDDNDDLYEDDTIGHVHIHKLKDCITLQCTVAFTRITSHTCIIKYDIYTKNIEFTNCECQNVACEHIIAFLMWWHRRSEERIENNMSFNLEPMTQETSFIKAKDLALDDDTDSAAESVGCEPVATTKGDIVQEFLIKCVQKKQFNSPLYKYMCNDEMTDLSMHRLACEFVKEGASEGAQPDLFLSYCARRLDARGAALARLADHVHCDVRQEMQYARIDGKHFLKAAEGDQDIVEEMMFPDMHVEDKAIEDISAIVRTKLSMNIQRTGLFISKEHPIFCAAPYGVSHQHVIDINYVKDGQTLEDFLIDGVLTKHVKARLQLYMFLTKKTNSILYLRYKDSNNKYQIQVHDYPFNSSFCNILLESATDFWKKNVYMKLLL